MVAAVVVMRFAGGVDWEEWWCGEAVVEEAMVVHACLGASPVWVGCYGPGVFKDDASMGVVGCGDESDPEVVGVPVFVVAD